MFSYTGRGADFVQASWTTRTAIVGQNDPFALTMSALPPGAVEIKSRAAWNYLADCAQGIDTITVNGAAVVGSNSPLLTPALCSGKPPW